jgi:hypothetical protein
MAKREKLVRVLICQVSHDGDFLLQVKWCKRREKEAQIKEHFGGMLLTFIKHQQKNIF